MVLVPLAVNPDTPVVAVAAHAKVAPPTFDVSVTNVELAPEQMVWVNGLLLTVGVGLTVIVNVIGAPVQVFPAFVYDGVTVIVAVTGALVAFVPVKLAILPVPLGARPMDGVLFVQLYTVPATDPLNTTEDVVLPLHTS